MILPQYLYRYDPKKELESIKKYGFKCGKPSRLMLNSVSNLIPSESELAIEQGWTVPHPNIMFSPRIYVFWKFESAFEWADANSAVVLRFSPLSLPHHDKNLYFSDGCFKDMLMAYYIVFPDLQIGDMVLPPSKIEIFVKDEEWVNLCNFSANLEEEDLY